MQGCQLPMLERNSHKGVLFGGLALLMLATRYHHFGDALHLPDASLAVFFLAGALLTSIAAFPLLLLEAGLIDYLAMSVNGVSDWCFSPAYWFLIPTYACLWLGGRWSPSIYALTSGQVIAVCAIFVVATSLAFIISNGSFYALSGKFQDLNLLEYGTRVVKYYPPYIFNAFLYTASAVIAVGLWQKFRKSPLSPSRLKKA